MARQTSAAFHGTAGSGRDDQGATIVPQITHADTAGRYSIFDYHAPPHFDGPPLHTHAYTTQWCYVVAGTLAFALDEATITVERGETVLIEPGVSHTFWNPTADPASLLMIAAPGGVDQWYAAQLHPDPQQVVGLASSCDVKLHSDAAFHR